MAITKPVVGQTDWGAAVNAALDQLDAGLTQVQADTAASLAASEAKTAEVATTRQRYARAWLFGGR